MISTEANISLEITWWILFSTIYSDLLSKVHFQKHIWKMDPDVQLEKILNAFAYVGIIYNQRFK